MLLKLNKNIIFREGKAFLLALGTWVITALIFFLILSLFFLSDIAGWISALLATLVSLFLAYKINDKKIPVLTLIIYLLYAIVVLGQVYVLTPTTIWHEAFPSYKDNQKILIEHVGKRVKQPQRGDLVSIKSQSNGNYYIQRIIGLPGEEVQIIEGSIKINKKWLNEPYHNNDSLCLIGNYLTNPITYSYKTDPYSQNYIALPDNRDKLNQYSWQDYRDYKILRDNIDGQIIGGNLNLKLVDSTSLKFNEYKNLNLGLYFNYSKGCSVIEQKDFIEIKNKKNNLTIFRITNLQNENKLSLEKFLRNEFTVSERIYCNENENCKIKPGNNLYEIIYKGKTENIDFVAGNLKTIKNNKPDISFRNFIGVNNKLYEVEPLNQDILKEITFMN